MFCNLNCLKAYSLTDKGLVFIQKIAAKTAKERAKKENVKLNERKVVLYEKENKTLLQKEINKLAKLIDAKCGLTTCICCGRDFGKQTDAAHYHSVGSNSSLRFHLENIWSSSSYCNNYSNTHLTGYFERLKDLFGESYRDYVVNELPLKCKSIKLSAKDIHEKLVLVRKLIRNFEKDNEGTFGFPDLIFKRNHYNKIIGIYK